MAGPSRPPFSQLPPPRAPQPSYTGWNPDPTFSPDFNQHMVQQYGPYHANTPPSPTPQPSQQPTPELGNPHCSTRLRQPVNRPDNTYRDEAPVDVFG